MFYFVKWIQDSPDIHVGHWKLLTFDSYCAGWGPHAYFQTLADTQSNTRMTHAANPLSIRSLEAEAGYIYTRQQV